MEKHEIKIPLTVLDQLLKTYFWANGYQYQIQCKIYIQNTLSPVFVHLGVQLKSPFEDGLKKRSPVKTVKKSSPVKIPVKVQLGLVEAQTYLYVSVPHCSGSRVL